MSELLQIRVIERQGGTQIRKELSGGVVNQYCQSAIDGAQLPAVVVYFDGTVYWLADGFHRVAAAEARGVEEILADVVAGTREAAVLYACGANEHTTHGLKRTNDDRRRAVRAALGVFEGRHVRASDELVAKTCGVGINLVATVRSQLTLEGKSPPPPAESLGKEAVGHADCHSELPAVVLTKRGGTMNTKGITEAAVKRAEEASGADAAREAARERKRKQRAAEAAAREADHARAVARNHAMRKPLEMRAGVPTDSAAAGMRQAFDRLWNLTAERPEVRTALVAYIWTVLSQYEKEPTCRI